MSAPLRIRIARGPAATGLIDAGWDALALAQPDANPARCREWMVAALAWPGARPLVARAERDGRPLAALALDVRPLTPRGGPRIGRLLAAPRPVTGADLMVDPAHPDAGVALLRGLRGELAGLEVTGAADGPLAAAMPRAFPWARAGDGGAPAWALDLPGPRLARRRERVAYHLRRAERLGARIERVEHRAPEAVAAALERLIELHRERWRGRAELTRFSTSAPERDWHRAAVAAMAGADRARVVEVREDGRPVAAILVLAAGRGAAFHVGAVAVDGRLKGPGHVAILMAVEAAIAAGATVADLGRGEEDYKLRFAPRRREAIRWVAAANRALQPALAAALAAQRRAVRLRRARAAPAS